MNHKVLGAMLVTLLLALVAGAQVNAQEPLRNEDVVKLTQAGLSEELVIAKINQAPTVEFDLEVEAIVKLKDDGVSEKVIQAMLERSSASPWGDSAARPAAGAPGGGAGELGRVSQEDLGYDVIRVALASSEGDVPLRILRGEMSTVAMGLMAFMDYPGVKARVRTSDPRPTLLVQSAAPLTGGRYFLARLDVDQDDGVRSLKISSAKGRLKAAFGNSRTFLEPDHDWVIDYRVEEAGPDLWRVIPREDLRPGEYGWYVDLGTGMQEAGLYGFGID